MKSEAYLAKKKAQYKAYLEEQRQVAKHWEYLGDMNSSPPRPKDEELECYDCVYCGERGPSNGGCKKYDGHYKDGKRYLKPIGIVYGEEKCKYYKKKA